MPVFMRSSGQSYDACRSWYVYLQLFDELRCVRCANIYIRVCLHACMRVYACVCSYASVRICVCSRVCIRV